MGVDEKQNVEQFVHYNVPKWIAENQKFFLLPVCNKMMHGKGQLKVFYVGGPNQRKDFHLQEGEEIFLQVKGDMTLVVQVQGKFKDVHIKEGQVFLLPAKIAHSPQRFENTVGLVIERERLKEESDCLRYFVGETTERLFEKWFYCEDLGTQLGPVIKEYYASEQHRTGKPIPGEIPENPPWVPDSIRCLEEPFYLSDWLKTHRDEINRNGYKELFKLASYQSDIEIYGSGEGKVIQRPGVETWLLQLEGNSELEIEGRKVNLAPQDSLLVAAGASMKHIRPKGSMTLSVVMNPSNKSRLS